MSVSERGSIATTTTCVRVDGGLVRLERTATAYPTMAAMHESNLGLAGALRAAPASAACCSICARGRPAATTTAFEHASGVVAQAAGRRVRARRRPGAHRRRQAAGAAAVARREARRQCARVHGRGRSAGLLERAVDGPQIDAFGRPRRRSPAACRCPSTSSSGCAGAEPRRRNICAMSYSKKAIMSVSTTSFHSRLALVAVAGLDGAHGAVVRRLGALGRRVDARRAAAARSRGPVAQRAEIVVPLAAVGRLEVRRRQRIDRLLGAAREIDDPQRAVDLRGSR